MSYLFLFKSNDLEVKFFHKVTSQSQTHDQHISIKRNVVTQEIHMNMKSLLYLFWFKFYDQDLVYMDRRPDRQSDS